MLEKIISGGQTGVDRAALDWAIRLSFPHGGWCPNGRRAEDGVIPMRYCLQETPSRHYQQRTKWNVRDSDATLIITPTADLSGGSKLTWEYARLCARPCVQVFPGDGWRDGLKEFLDLNAIRILNVAGSRASRASGIEEFVQDVLDEARVFFDR